MLNELIKEYQPKGSKVVGGTLTMTAISSTRRLSPAGRRFQIFARKPEDKTPSLRLCCPDGALNSGLIFYAPDGHQIGQLLGEKRSRDTKRPFAPASNCT